MIQKPFAYLAERERRIRRPTRPPIKELPKNIRGICSDCGFKVQKVRYTTTTKLTKDPITGKILEKATKIAKSCTRCLQRGRRGNIIELPKELLPWKILSPNYGIDFYCSICQRRYVSYSIFGTACSHKKHQYPHASICRFCCTKVSNKKENPEDTEVQNPPEGANEGSNIPSIERVSRGIGQPELIYWEPELSTFTPYSPNYDDLLNAANAIRENTRATYYQSLAVAYTDAASNSILPHEESELFIDDEDDNPF